jgi:hypothetical protein
MQHLDEGTIHAWLDGALSAEESARVETHVASCATCADAVAEVRGLIAASSRILTALDDVPSIKGAKGAKGAGGRLFLLTWLVRERIAAVVAVIVAAGALAVMMSRDASRSALLDTTSLPVDLEVAETNLPQPTPAAPPEAERQPQTRRAVPGRSTGFARSRPQGVATRQADTAAAPYFDSVTQMAAAEAHAPPVVRTDDSIRAAVTRDSTWVTAVVAGAARKDVQPLAVEGKPSVAEKLARALPGRRDAADAAARFVPPPPPLSGRGVAGGVAQSAPNVRLLQQEQMKEGDRDIRRRIYRVDDLLVTLDERLPVAMEERRERAANLMAPAAVPAPAADSATASVNTVRWIDARGFELSLTGAATKERLEQIKKVLGY